jgi:hypothetical protein
LTDLVTGAGPGGTEKATLVVHADAGVLSGEQPAERTSVAETATGHSPSVAETATGHNPSVAETATGQRLSAETVRRLACDGLVELVLERDGAPVGIGRRGRTVPGYLSRALRHRDRGCRFPGCEHTKWLYAHHLVHWADGGATNLENLVLLCSAHHRLIHEGGWRTSGHPERNLRFHDPGGRPLPTRPPAADPSVRARYFASGATLRS